MKTANAFMTVRKRKWDFLYQQLLRLVFISIRDKFLLISSSVQHDSPEQLYQKSSHGSPAAKSRKEKERAGVKSGGANLLIS